MSALVQCNFWAKNLVGQGISREDDTSASCLFLAKIKHSKDNLLR